MTLTVPTDSRKLQQTRQTAGAGAETRARLLGNDHEALAVRLRLIESAILSIDLQYYYWAADTSGRLVMAAVLRAADRGVQVRILLDDFNSGGLDHSFAALDAHPNVAVRLFNPLRFRFNGLARIVAFVSTFVTANNRMHNKNLIVDRRHAVVGGRNLGDAYFGIDRGTNFHDIDMHVEGPAVTDSASIFDSYWTATASRRVSRLIGRAPQKLGALRARLQKLEQSAEAQDVLQTLDLIHGSSCGGTMAAVERMIVAADPPAKAVLRERMDWVGPRIETLIASARTEVVLLSPYFVPGEDGAALFERILSGGVKVKVLTNSLAATDVVIAHSGYVRYRKRLLGAGLELYEQPPRLPREKIHVFGSRRASLHTKSVLVDGRRGFVGSFNFDPRSKSINTEMGLFFDDGTLAGRLDGELDRHFARALRVTLDDGRLSWRDQNTVVSRGSEPFAGPGRRLIAAIAGLFPLESQL